MMHNFVDVCASIYMHIHKGFLIMQLSSAIVDFMFHMCNSVATLNNSSMKRGKLHFLKKYFQLQVLYHSKASECATR